ncbi:BrnT family toxin [Pseudorhizobium pelagicum]|uniref:BrnT family toxin n=1 Tax=Pseudorhizobium pelagicum TaxID=1509405 RepID=UPI00055AE51A|nr:BrnT family toxin [Pseudorhizobium pelagicum]
MEFEFDPAKSASNKDKHGIDFVEAQALWRDIHSITFPAREEDEFRMMVIGRIAGKHWSAIIVHRGPRIRIISARRSRKQEVELYESQRSG